MFYKRINSFISKYQLINKFDSIVVGVSSGPDSMFLLGFLNALKKELQLTISVAHINHHTRGLENVEEQNLVKNYCDSNDIPFFHRDYIRDTNVNFHESARDFRYTFFKELAHELKANKIAVAHHEDDQVETILFKIMRGNHIGGYLGMKPIYELDSSLFVIRPLLTVTKNEIIELCSEHKIPYAQDPSNDKNTYTRNRIRNQIIPLFNELQPDFNDKIGQFQQQLGEAYDYLEQKAKYIYQQMIISCEKDRIILDLKIIKKTHVAILRPILLNVISDLTDNNLELTFEKIKNIINIINNDKANVVFKLGNQYFCIKEYDILKFQFGYKEVNGYSTRVNDFGVYDLPNGMKIRMKKVQEIAKSNNNSLILCYNSTIWPLVIRTRYDGDYIKLKIGTKKINRVFIDQKIPINLRNTWPLLVDKNNEVLWILGLKKPDFQKVVDCNEYILIEVL